MNKNTKNDVREDDVEKLAKERYPEYYSVGLGGDRIGFERGYNLAKENTYTEEQVREAIRKAPLVNIDSIIQTLKQLK